MLTVAPIELDASDTSGVFMTLSWPMKSTPTVEKSIWRPPVAVEMRRPSYSVVLKSPPKPRTVMPVGSPRTRTLDRHARQALQRRRDVRVGEFTDIFRGDDVDDARRGTLDVEVALERAAKAGDDDVRLVRGVALADVLRGGGVLRLAGFLRGGGVGGGGNGRLRRRGRVGRAVLKIALILREGRGGPGERQDAGGAGERARPAADSGGRTDRHIHF
jgi:hypothetical protein